MILDPFDSLIPRCLAPLLVAAAIVARPAAAEPVVPTLVCLPVDSCGCRILVNGQSCPAGSVHFFHELADGAPLRFDLGTGPIRAVSTRARSDTFTPSQGDTWTQTYRYGGGIEVQYFPGLDTCPKRAPDESCEYFDVSVRVLFHGPQGETSYQGVGTCGC